MVMKKAEMEKHRMEYRALMDQARAALQEGLYRNAVKAALSSWDHVDGMMQFERKYENREFTSIESIELVLRYAPLLLDSQSLDRLASLLKSQRRIDKNTSVSLDDKLAKARAQIWDAHKLWEYLEGHPDTRQDELRQILGGEQEEWRSAAEAWEKMGLVRRTPEGRSYRLALSTRMGEIVSGKCPSCGAVAEAPKAMFLEELTCQYCQASGVFVILSRRAPSTNKE